MSSCSVWIVFFPWTRCEEKQHDLTTYLSYWCFWAGGAEQHNSFEFVARVSEATLQLRSVYLGKEHQRSPQAGKPCSVPKVTKIIATLTQNKNTMLFYFLLQYKEGWWNPDPPNVNHDLKNTCIYKLFLRHLNMVWHIPKLLNLQNTSLN